MFTDVALTGVGTAAIAFVGGAKARINRKDAIIAVAWCCGRFPFLRDKRKIALRNKMVDARMKPIVANSGGLRPVGW